MSEDEVAGQKPLIIRRRVLHSHFGLDLPNKNNSDIDWGDPMSERTFDELVKFSQEQTSDFVKDYGGVLKIQDNTIRAVADFANTKFSFRNQGTGIATLPKQLENYKTLPSNEIAENLDCKFATVMTGLILQKLAQDKNHSLRLKIISKGSGVSPHPSLLVSTNGENILVDFHTDRDTGISGFTIRTLSSNGEQALNERAASVNLDLDGLRQLDEAFLKD